MGSVDYRDGIAILQLIVFPVLLVTALFIWKRTGWKAGGKSWRYVVTLSLIRIAGSIATLLTINNNNKQIYIAEAVCELIGIAPLLLTYIGILRQIDEDHKIPPRALNVAAIVGIVGLILGIAGVSKNDQDSTGPYHPNGFVQGAMGVFLAVFVITVLLTIYLGLQLRSLHSWQKKLFLAIILSWPFLIIRLVYSAIGDYTTDERFIVLSGDPTTYLCMSVLEEIVAMSLCAVFGTMAVLERERGKVVYSEMAPTPYNYGV